MPIIAHCPGYTKKQPTVFNIDLSLLVLYCSYLGFWRRRPFCSLPNCLLPSPSLPPPPRHPDYCYPSRSYPAYCYPSRSYPECCYPYPSHPDSSTHFPISYRVCIPIQPFRLFLPYDDIHILRDVVIFSQLPRLCFCPSSILLNC